MQVPSPKHPGARSRSSHCNTRRRVHPLSALLTLLLACAWASATRADESPTSFDAFVLKVIDGDTIDVLPATGGEQRIRLAGIDAPERSQSWGADATRALSAAVLNRRVVLHVTDRDPWGRLVARVHIDGADVNLALVRAGHAWAYRQYTSDEALITAEEEAKDTKRGLWATDGPIPPWSFRAGTRREEAVSGAAPFGGECASRRLCSEMRSCAEARWYLESCGLTALDRDEDGTPCESLCKD